MAGVKQWFDPSFHFTKPSLYAHQMKKGFRLRCDHTSITFHETKLYNILTIIFGNKSFIGVERKFQAKC